jgi:hypothetical protein
MMFAFDKKTLDKNRCLLRYCVQDFERASGMKNLYLLLFFVASLVHGLVAQDWGYLPGGDSRFLFIRALTPYQQGGFTFTPIETVGSVPMAELTGYGLASMAGGTLKARYFLFNGDYVVIQRIYGGHLTYVKKAIFGWPGGIIKQEDLIPGHPNSYDRTYSFVCGCFDASEDPQPPDSARLADGFGYWELIYPTPPEWPYWNGYTYYGCHAHPCIILPCPSGTFEEKREFVFTDSLYNELPERSLISGQSRLYFKANRPSGYLGTYARLYLQTDPDNDTLVAMTYHGDEYWRGSLENSLLLGLRSYNLVIGEFYTIWPDSTEHFRDDDRVEVGLPVIETSTDTVIIRTDSMKVRDDLIASLFFRDDQGGGLISAAVRVDSAGFRDSSFWVANSSRADTRWHQRYRRHYPTDSTYLWWQKNPDSCNVKFWRDSLSVVGGSLSVVCVGALNEIPNIDNRFSVNTDSVINDTARATKLITVDQDPVNDMFYDSLGSDIIRAIAWVEYAGSNDATHCDDHYNPPWNNYWDDVITGTDTCFETKYPCENIISTATGTMQMIRTVWEPAFTRPDYVPTGYYRVSWDSLAWNWALNVFNGKFIYWTDNFFRINLPTNPQRNWDSLCVLCDPADSVPLYPNKEDLSTFGYKRGATEMMNITKDSWNRTMEDTDGGRYVQKVRGSKYARHWEE